jgi:hypothetical protein
MSDVFLLAAVSATRKTFEWGRIQSNTDWIAPVAVCVAIMVFVRVLYRHDANELGIAWGWFLTILRTFAFAGLLILYLQPQWRNEREETVNSQVVVLVDTSLSMSLSDTDPAAPKSLKGVTRAQQVAALLGSSSLLDELRKTHDVVVTRFDQDLQRVATLPKLTPQAEPAEMSPVPNSVSSTASNPAPIDWQKVLQPSGTETRLGQSLQQLLLDEQGGSLSGVLLLTDGGQNAGAAPDAAIQAARDFKIPIFPVGVGSDRLPAEVRISDMTAPPRAYPGDRYTVTGYLQAQRMSGKQATVELLSRDAGNAKAAAEPEHLEGATQVTLGKDGEVVPVKFDITPEKTGRRTLVLRVKAAGVNRGAADTQREADVEIVDHKNRVLLVAGGPSREYQFLRSLLFRDKSTTLDVLLQSGQTGLSQDASRILDSFPSSRQDMFAYDCVVAIDPDWESIGTAQIDLLEQWVAEQGGGLIVAAGPVYAGRAINGWTQDPAMAKVRALYPVEFQRSLAMLDNSAYISKDPWPLDFSREGFDAEYLWLDDSAAASQEAWSEFAGVYSFHPVRSLKPGAAALARFSDPRAAEGGKQPVYFAVQYYGSGRVFYMGSAEMWRLRRASDALFERFYTKLIRHVSQGRLLRGSARGLLLVGQDRGYLVGNTVDVRARLTNAQFESLKAPSVPLQVISPDGTSQTINLMPNPARQGSYAGHFAAAREGTYRLELPIPESNDQRLTRRVQVDLPRSELKEPQRNDALLSRMARQTGGHYYVGTEAAMGRPSSEPPLVPQLKDRTRTSVHTASPDSRWEETWMGWMMYALCFLLCAEWLTRRLLKLA